VAKLPRRLKALPADVAYSFKALGRRAAGAGMGAFVQQILAGFITSELRKARLDQVHALLSSGAFLADLIDENHPPARWRAMLGLIGRFVDPRSLGALVDEAVTPELCAGAVKEANIEAYSLIINHPGGGLKWFHDQAAYLKKKIKRILEVAS